MRKPSLDKTGISVAIQLMKGKSKIQARCVSLRSRLFRQTCFTAVRVPSLWLVIYSRWLHGIPQTAEHSSTASCRSHWAIPWWLHPSCCCPWVPVKRLTYLAEIVHFCFTSVHFWPRCLSDGCLYLQIFCEPRQNSCYMEQPQWAPERGCFSSSARHVTSLEMNEFLILEVTLKKKKKKPNVQLVNETAILRGEENA